MNIIEIHIAGPASSGKTHVLAVIEKALKETYGHYTQVASVDLELERAILKDDEFYKPSPDKTVFVLTETVKQ